MKLSVEIYQLHRINRGLQMHTVQEIIAYLETELAAAHEAHDHAKDKQERVFHLIKAATIESILDEIKR